jgi:flagellar M-ring protein FliF
MNADDVAVIDANGVLIGQGGESKNGQQGEERAARLRERVLRLIEARVGPGNAVVEVSVETVTEQRSVRERRIDPDSRVAISKDVEETSDSSTSKPASVTVASNLPDGEASGGDTGSEQASTSRERVNYEISQTEVEVIQRPGDVRRLTVAVLVNGISAEGPDGSVEFRPRSDEELAALRELVAAAVGFNETRGDVITIRSMELPALESPETAPAVSWFDRVNIDLTKIAQAAALAIVALILGLFVIRPLLMADGRASQKIAGLPNANLKDPANALPVLDGEIDDQSYGETLGVTDNSTISDVQLPSPLAEDPVDRLRAMIGERQEETVQILRSWLQEEEETA